ncbi:MAG: hypothetical protein N2578_00250 [Bdellovibrionaceae bacterium]|nr:hypothetical protein [Pseudobdellovibrionaceae bacterium]
MNIILGRTADVGGNWVLSRGTQPSTVFGTVNRHNVKLTIPGDSDGFSSNLGTWFSSQVIPINLGASLTFRNYGCNGPGTTGWVYMVIRAYSL